MRYLRDGLGAVLKSVGWQVVTCGGNARLVRGEMAVGVRRQVVRAVVRLVAKLVVIEVLVGLAVVMRL
jgi:hypothetical protein